MFNTRQAGTVTKTLTMSDVGDVYTVEWTDYSSSSTVTGWASTPTIAIRYKKIGKLVFVQYKISGTSNLATASFTVPYDNNSSQATYAGGVRTYHGSTYEFGYLSVATSSDVVGLYRDSASTSWPTSGDKIVYGQFWYQTT